MTITLTLVKPLIIENVKNETFFRGQIDKADNDKAITTAYHEQAGDDTYQERMLERGLYTALEELKTRLSDYISTTGYSTADNSIDSSMDGDNITIHLIVSERFNKGYTQSLARLSSKYVEESMLVDWWKPVNEKQAQLYLAFMERDLAAIQRCFNKTAPIVPTVPYTTFIRTTGSAIEMEPSELATITYEISDGAIDDIECRVQDNTIVKAERAECGVLLTAQRRGHTYITLYSRHNEDVTTNIHVYVTDHS